MRNSLYQDRLTRKRNERVSHFFSQGVALATYGLLPLLIIGSLCYFLFFSSFFVIERVELETGEGIDQSRVRSVLFEYMNTNKTFVWGHTNLFFFDKKKAVQALAVHFIVNHASFSKKIPKTLSVAFEGYPFHAYVIRENNLHELNSNGVVGNSIDSSLLNTIPQSLRTSIFQMPQQDDGVYRRGKKRYPLFIIDTSESINNTNNQFIDRSSLLALDGFFSDLYDQKLFPSHITFKNAGEGALITLLEGWELSISLDGDKDVQIKNLKETLSQKIKKDRKKLKKVDLRFGNKVYYSFK